MAWHSRGGNILIAQKMKFGLSLFSPMLWLLYLWKQTSRKQILNLKLLCTQCLLQKNPVIRTSHYSQSAKVSSLCHCHFSWAVVSIPSSLNPTWLFFSFIDKKQEENWLNSFILGSLIFFQIHLFHKIWIQILRGWGSRRGFASYFIFLYYSTKV